MSEHYQRTPHDIDPDEVPREAVEFDREIQFRQLVILGVSLVAITFLSGVVVFFMLRGLLRAEARGAAPPPVMAPAAEKVPGPLLLARPEQELERVRAHEDSVLGSYGWVDPARGIGRIPIERAMERLLEQGLPARPASPMGAGAGQPLASTDPSEAAATTEASAPAPTAADAATTASATSAATPHQEHP